jgi:hypothetical protein
VNETLLDRLIDTKLEKLKEEKYKLRIFQVELLLRIDSDNGVEETLQDIRSISGVTVVSAMDSSYQRSETSYLSHIKVKFHPRLDSTTAETFLEDNLLPTIRGREIPGTKVVRVISQPIQIS